MEINEEINTIILRYISDNKKIDDQFFDKIIKTYIEYYRLDNYISKINYSCKKKSDDLANYSYFYKLITIYSKVLFNEINKIKRNIQNHYPLSKKERIYISYIICVLTIRHEIEHARQSNMFDNGYSNLEEEILTKENNLIYSSNSELKRYIKGDFEGYLAKLDYFLKLNYDKLLCERLAQHYSYECVIDMISNYSPVLCQYFIKCKEVNLFKGYEIIGDKIISPTYHVINGLHKLRGVPNYDYSYLSPSYEETKEKIKTLSFETRFKLGLPLEKEEYAGLNI